MRSCHALGLAAVFSLCSCNQGKGAAYKIDTVTFSGEAPVTTGMAPGLTIDTNIKVSGLWGGTVKSAKPYSVLIQYTDETEKLKELLVTKLSIVAADGTEDPGTKGIELPIRIGARDYETPNSVAGGRIVISRVLLAAGKIAGAVTRDVSVTMNVEGQFVMVDGSKIPFSVTQAFKAKREVATRPWSEVMTD